MFSAHLSGDSTYDPQQVFFMQEALREGQKALDEAEVPVGCVFVKNGEIVLRGRNETNEFCDATRHAEIVAMEKVQNQVQGMDLYVTVEPCIMCAAALASARIGKVYYGADNDKFGGCGSVVSIHEASTFPNQPAYPSFSCESGLGKNEAIGLLRDFYMRENGRAPKPRLDSMALRKAKRHAKDENGESSSGEEEET